jgi:isochorismate pyruvate lyase
MPQDLPKHVRLAVATRTDHRSRIRMAASDQTITPPDQCLDMPTLRIEIDRIDRALAGLLAERQGYIVRAAAIKTRRGDVRDEARIADVLSKVSAAAEAAGLDVDIARAVWRTLMEQSIALEMDRFDALQRAK